MFRVISGRLMVDEEEVEAEELLDALEALQLCAFLPALRAPGVECLADVGDFLTGVLEEAGLSRVQLRRVQLLASGGGAGPVVVVRRGCG